VGPQLRAATHSQAPHKPLLPTSQASGHLKRATCRGSAAPPRHIHALLQLLLLLLLLLLLPSLVCS